MKIASAACVVCGHNQLAALEAVLVAGRSRLACAPHAAVARAAKPRSIAALVRACAPTIARADRRAGGERRDTPLDRRAFWRPTPDRRREASERGRRAQDLA